MAPLQLPRAPLAHVAFSGVGEGALHVVAYAPGGLAPHTGTTVVPDDFFVSANGCSAVMKLLDGGQLRVTDAASVVLMIVRPPRVRTDAKDLGGHPGQVKPKFAARASAKCPPAANYLPPAVAPPVSRVDGGAPGRATLKPQRAPASRKKPAKVAPLPEAVGAQVRAMREELLRDGGLSHAEQAEVDAELAGATYVE